MHVGDRLAEIPDVGRVLTVKTVACEEPHPGEVFAELTMTDGDFPGRVAIVKFQERRARPTDRLRYWVLPAVKGRYMVCDRVHSSAGVPASGGADTLLARELSADFYRVLAVVIVVIGHWLVSAVTFRDGRFGNDYPLAVLPWTQWLTLVFQVVPVFFLVGGYASAASWTRWLDAGGRQWSDWLRHRLGAILGPTTVYVVLALAMVAVLVWLVLRTHRCRSGDGRSPCICGLCPSISSWWR